MKSNIELFFSGDEYFLRVLEEIGKAQAQILFESYLFEYDEIGRTMLAALARAVERQVRVQILVDGVGSSQSASQISEFCGANGIDMRVYHPLPFHFYSLRRFSLRALRRWTALLQRINKRDHRKMIIIDHHEVFLGSFNISQVHSERLSGPACWRDTAALVKMPHKAPEVLRLQQAFGESFASARFFTRTNWRAFIRPRLPKRPPSQALFRLNSRPSWRFVLLRDLNRRIRQAKTRIMITNAYFLPRKSILRNLRRAAQRGVEVSILLPEKTDAWFVREASRSLYSRMLKSGIKIFEYQNRILHAKTFIIDQWATVGSHNLNHRSLNHDLEVEVVLEDQQNLDILLTQWHRDLRSAKLISVASIGSVFWPRAIFSRCLYWFRFWI